MELKKQLSDGCIDFTELGAGTEEEAQENEKSSTIMEEIAMEDETAMESFLETGRIAGEQIREMIVQRKIFPCFLVLRFGMPAWTHFYRGLTDIHWHRNTRMNLA